MIKLNEFQKNAIRFLFSRYGKSSLIKGGTGKGKTLAVLGYSNLLRQKGVNHRMVVLCPKTAVSSFERDLNKFGDELGLSGVCIHTNKDITKWIAIRKEERDKHDIVVIALHVLAELPDSLLDSFTGFSHLVIDEIHDLRNFTSKKYRNAMYLKLRLSLNVIGLTATLFYTRLEDVFAIMKFIDGDIFPNYEEFRNDYLRFIDKDITIQTRVNDNIGTTNVQNRATIKSFDGYQDNVQDVWNKIESCVYSDLDSSRFNISYEFVKYEIEDIEALKNKLKGEGIYSVLNIQIRHTNGMKCKELSKKPSDLLPTFQSGIRVEKRADSIRVGDVVYANNSDVYRIERISKEVDDTRLAQVIIPVVQKYLSASDEKYRKLLDILNDGKGTLIYCEYIPSAKKLQELLNKEYRLASRRVYLLDGSVKNKKLAISGIDWDVDIVIATQSASQSMDYYFDRVVLYEPISHAGKFLQFQGRIMRADTKHTELKVMMLCCFDTLEEYYYHRICMFIKQSKAYDIKLPIETGFDSLEDLKRLKLWGLLRER